MAPPSARERERGLIRVQGLITRKAVCAAMSGCKLAGSGGLTASDQEEPHATDLQMRLEENACVCTHVSPCVCVRACAWCVCVCLMLSQSSVLPGSVVAAINEQSANEPGIVGPPVHRYPMQSSKAESSLMQNASPPPSLC